MILLKIIVNFYILMVLLFIASIITWQSLKKNTYPPQGKWIMYGVLSGFIALSIVLLIMIISVNVLFQGILQ